ncbi:quinone oxidoreductase-like protein 2 homolog [Styela clava]
MSLRVANLATKMIRCPPEVILRPLARGDHVQRRLLTQENVASTMKRFYRTAVCTELKKPMIISQKESEDVDLDQVRIKVEAAAVNFGDILTVEGTYQEKIEPPFTPGNEFSGIVTEVGPEAKRIKPGTRVCGMSYGNAYAEEIIVNEGAVFEIPDEMSYASAAGFVVSYATAILALEKKGRIKRGESILITAAAGAVGLAALDLAKNVYGAEVFCAAGGEEKCQFLRQKGSTAIDYKKENIRTIVKSIKPRGVDLVFEVVGGDVFKDCFRSMAPDGRLLIIGFASGKHPMIPANHTLVKNVSVIGIYWGSYRGIDPQLFMWTITEVFKHFKAGKLKPHVDKTFKLEQVNEAFEYIRARKNIGKVVLEMT